MNADLLQIFDPGGVIFHHGGCQECSYVRLLLPGGPPRMCRAEVLEGVEWHACAAHCPTSRVPLRALAIVLDA
jgi:hypothetical protein